jgi:hypothetical protein
LVLEHIGPTTLCAIHPHVPGLLGCWLDDEKVTATAEWVERLNAEGYNIYFTLNLPNAGLTKKPSKREIVELRALAADIDAKNGRSLDEAFALIGRVKVPPNLVIATGGGFQPIWKFAEPLPATDENIRRVEALGRRIVRLTGSDPIQNIDRILRMPFTLNYPNAAKRAAGRVPCLSGLVLTDDPR